eukprot:15352558-Ditylum_brightwellii.AAC.1
MLWPYALLAAADQLNKFIVDQDRISPEEKFCDTKLVQDLKGEHTWGCPIHVLDKKLQGGTGDTWSLPNDANLKPDEDLELPILLQEKNTEPVVMQLTDGSTNWLSLDLQRTKLDSNVDLPESCNNAPTQPSAHHKGDNGINGNQVMHQMIDLASADLRRSTRTKTLTNKALESSDPEIQKIFCLCTMCKALVTKVSDMKQLPQQMCQCAIYNIEVSNCLYDESLNYLHPMVFAANKQQNKTYTFKDMMK